MIKQTKQKGNDMNKSLMFAILVLCAIQQSANANEITTLQKNVQAQIDDIKHRTTENYNKLNDKIEKSYNKLNDKIDATLDKITSKLDKSIQDNYDNGINIINSTNDNFYYLLYSLIGMFSAVAGWALLYVLNKLPKMRSKG